MADMPRAESVGCVIGIDLSGPANPGDTEVAVFEREAGGLLLSERLDGAGDREIFRLVERRLAVGTVALGIDAPLSYNPGGGDRDSDRALRELLVARGLPPGSVMSPTMTRMAYLTLRGIAVARGVRECGRERLCLAEVHPGAVMALRDAPSELVISFKRSPPARRQLLEWLSGMGLVGVEAEPGPSDHFVAACAAALGAWNWLQGRAAWCARAQPPLHPFDFAA